MANPLVGKSTMTWSITGVVAFIVGVLQLPQTSAFISTFLAAHPQVTALGAGILTILALFFKPQTTTPPPPSPTAQAYRDYKA